MPTPEARLWSRVLNQINLNLTGPNRSACMVISMLNGMAKRQKEADMNVLNSGSGRQSVSEHWNTIDSSGTAPEHRPLRVLGRKLEEALADLGRIEYSLSSALTQLRFDSAATHDNLHAHVANDLEGQLQAAVIHLAEELRKAKRHAETCANLG